MNRISPKPIISSCFLYFVIVFVFSSVDSFCQGSWNLKYLPVDSLNASFLNKEIRIDFKASTTDTLSKKAGEFSFNIRQLLAIKDTVKIKVEKGNIMFIENWILYPDQGILSEQTLVSVDKYSSKKLVIKEMVLLSINDSTLTLNIHLYTTHKILPDKEHIEHDKIENIIIDKSIIKGFLLKR